MLRRRDRRRRNQRIGAAVTALAVAGALVAGVSLAAHERSEVVPGGEPIGAGNVAGLREIWSAKVGDAPTPVLSQGVVANANTHGHVVAFSETCRADGSTCAPLWTAEIGDVPERDDRLDPSIEWWQGAADLPNGAERSGSLTGADGRFYALAGDATVYAFDANCRSDGGVCEPLWTAKAGHDATDSSLPMVSDGHVYLVDRAGTFAFEADCPRTRCEPLWHVPIVGPLRVQGGHLYVTDGPGQAAMELDPDTGRTIWTGEIGPCCGNTPTPVRLRDRVYVNTGRMLWAFPASCRGTCAPAWSTSIPDRFSDGPILAGDTLVLSSARNGDVGGVWFIPLACARHGSGCESGRRAAVQAELTTQPPVSSGSMVFATSRRGGGFFSFDVACATTGEQCARLGTDPTPLQPTQPVAVGDVVFVANELGSLDAYRQDCSGLCDPVWSAPDITPVQQPLVDGGFLLSMDDFGTLHAYATGGPLPVASAPATDAGPGLAPWFSLGLASVICVVYVVRRRRTTH
jgi:outer membrane protein assembly factor BamB